MLSRNNMSPTPNSKYKDRTIQQENIKWNEDEEKIAPEAKLKDDLGIDSLDFVDIVVIVEKNFGFKIKPEEMQGVTTLTQFCDYIESKVG